MHNFETTLEDCREGDAQAWEALVRFYQGRVFAVSYYYLKNREDAVDVAQDSFIKVYGQLDSFDGDGDSFLPWLLAITRNCAIDRIRKTNTRSRYEEEFEHSAPKEDVASNPENQLHQGQSVSLLYSALEKLNPLNRDIVLLKDIQGLKLKDVAIILS